MKTFIVCNPLKENKLEEYNKFVKDFITLGYGKKFQKYGIENVKVWHKKINNSDYIIVLHEVSDNFDQLIENLFISKLPEDIWFKENLINLYETHCSNDLDAIKKLFKKESEIS
ncbi:MAG: hypothetical protein GY756_20720 [bacterium]|nr:hypothetical protein [bacterium]